jgi:glycosyltransferase involved in cell wall biosynthesis
MSKVALIATNLAGSGAEKVVLNLARMFESHGDEVHIFLLEDVISYRTEGYSIHTLSKKRNFYKALKGIGDRILAQRLRKKIEELSKNGERFDLILSNLPAADRVTVSANLEHTFYLIHTSYSMELEEFRKRGEHQRANKKEKLYRTLYHDKNLIAVSEGIKMDLDSMDIAYRSCNVIYNPFDISRIRAEANEKKNILQEPYLLSASAFRPVKRHDILLEAYSILDDPPPLKLLCNPSADLEHLIQKYHLEDKVEILGFTKNPYPIIKQAYALILSSEREGLPTVLIEALIVGTPVVSTDCKSGPNEILVGKLRKYLARVNDSLDLADKIERILKDSPKIENRYVDKFDADKVYQNYISLLDH